MKGIESQGTKINVILKRSQYDINVDILRVWQDFGIIDT